jgi:stage II sporulation protein D
MKRILLLLFAAAWSDAQTPEATTIALRLFSTHAVREVTATPLGRNAWEQRCQTCMRTAVTAPLHLEHLKSAVQLSGNFRLATDAGAGSAEAAGVFTIAPSDDEMKVTLEVPSERYVAAVLAAEAAQDEPQASLEALAIVARTYALENLARHQAEGFDLCDSTHCQALRMNTVRPTIAQAVRDTAGITLWSGSQRARVYYTQHCGGMSASVEEVWPDLREPYLVSHKDPYCLRRSSASWQTEIPLTELYRIAQEQHWNIPRDVTAVRVAQRTASGRVKLLEAMGTTGRASISASSLHFAVNRALGWNRIRSDLYDVSLSNGALHFVGHGYGHGVGLCQGGAYEMALEHKSAEEILEFYFPKTHSGLTSAGEVWQSETVEPVTVHTTKKDAALDQATAKAWQRSAQLFPSHGPERRVTLTVAPTTELFRQMTSSPGYLLAVTRGDEITIQPMAVLRRSGDVNKLLVHELLHAMIERQVADKAPLWLREGLAEALADLPSGYKPPTMPAAKIEEVLRQPENLAADQKAHREAAALVRMLGQKYSLEVMREWLHGGVPESVMKTIQ